MSENKLIFQKLDDMDKKQDVMNVHVTEIRKDLNHHIEQTAILRAEVTPIRNSHQQIIGVLKFLGLISLLVSIAIGISQLLH